jgi:hypothetical protein
MEELHGKVPRASPLEKKYQSGIVTVDTDKARLLVERLEEKRTNVSASSASGTDGINCPHFFNLKADSSV